MASRICPHCGQEAPRTAKFCSQCAASLVGEPTIPRPPQHVEQTKIDVVAARSKTVLMSVLAGAVVILVAVAGFAVNKYTSVLNSTPVAPVSAPPVVEVAPTTPPAAPPVIQAPAAPPPSAPPVTQAPQPTAIVPPPAVVTYLAFVQQMEQSRLTLEQNQIAAVLPLLTTAQDLKTDNSEDKTNGTTQIDQAMTSNLGKWQALIARFQAQTPPDGCDQLANSYYKFLQDYTDLSSQIQVALENGDTAKVIGLQGAQTIVDQDASAADGALLAVCNHFNAKKLFVISADGSSAGTSLVGG
jgi:hypothetical protein